MPTEPGRHLISLSSSVEELLRKCNTSSFMLGDEAVLQCSTFLSRAKGSADLILGGQLLWGVSQIEEQEVLTHLSGSLDFVTGVTTFLQFVNGINTVESVEQQSACLFAIEAIARASVEATRFFVSTLSSDTILCKKLVTAIASNIRESPSPCVQQIRIELLLCFNMLFKIPSSVAEHIKSCIPDEVKAKLNKSSNLCDFISNTNEIHQILNEVNVDNRNIKSFRFNSFYRIEAGSTSIVDTPESTGWIHFCCFSFFIQFNNRDDFLEFRNSGISQLSFVIKSNDMILGFEERPKGDLTSLAIGEESTNPFPKFSLSFDEPSASLKAHAVAKSFLAGTELDLERSQTVSRKLSTVSSKAQDHANITPMTSGGREKKLNETESCELITSPETTPANKNSTKPAIQKGPKPSSALSSKLKSSLPLPLPKTSKDLNIASTSNKESTVHQENGGALQTLSGSKFPQTLLPHKTDTAHMKKPQKDNMSDADGAKSSLGPKRDPKKSKGTSTGVVSAAPKREKRIREQDENENNATDGMEPSKATKLGNFSNASSISVKSKLHLAAGGEMEVDEPVPSHDPHFMEDSPVQSGNNTSPLMTSFPMQQDLTENSQPDLFSSSDLSFNMEVSGGDLDLRAPDNYSESSTDVDEVFTQLMKKLTTLQADREKRKVDNTISQAVKQATKQIEEYLSQWESMHQNEMCQKAETLLQKCDSYTELNEQLNTNIRNDCSEIASKIKEVAAENAHANEKFHSAKAEYSAFLQHCKDEDKRIKHDLGKRRADARETAKKTVVSKATESAEKSVRKIANEFG